MSAAAEDQKFWGELYDDARTVMRTRQKIERKGMLGGKAVTVTLYRVHEFVPVRIEVKVKPE